MEITGRFETISTAVDSNFKEWHDIFAGVQQQLQIFDLHFEKVDEQLNDFRIQLNDFGVRLNDFGVRLNKVEVRLDKVEVRLDKIEDRLDKVEVRLDKIEDRLDKIEATMATKNDLAVLRDQVVEAMDQMLAKWLSQGPAAQ